MAKQLLGIAESAESEAVKLAAVRDLLDRAGLNPPAEVEISPSYGLALVRPTSRWDAVECLCWSAVASCGASWTQRESRWLRLKPGGKPALRSADLGTNLGTKLCGRPEMGWTQRSLVDD